jgi:hypothetical protein
MHFQGKLKEDKLSINFKRHLEELNREGDEGNKHRPLKLQASHHHDDLPL